MSSNTFSIDQCLHGYNSGHTLFSSSLEFDPEVKSTLQIMSDMSGQSMQPGFEEYMTGYPLQEINKYALAKTWYAPEMKRPGCVWTHTLLIDFSDLANVVNFKGLTGLFHRPAAEVDKKMYTRPVEFGNMTEQLPLVSINSKNLNLISEIISSLYSKPSVPVLIKVKDTANISDLMLAVWLQQWPRLRRNFAFCTGSISVRVLDGRPLDLQAIPSKSENSLSRNLEYSLLDPEAVYGAPDVTDWLNITTHDLVTPSGLRMFLKEYGADVGASRSSFKPLVDMFKMLSVNPTIDINEVMKQVALHYPQPSDASRLKQALLSNQESHNTLFSAKMTEADLLYCLATTEYYSAIDFGKLDFENRFQLLFDRDRNLAFSLIDKLINSDLNPFGEVILELIAQKINTTDLISINQRYKRNLLLVFAGLNPSLSYNKIFWEQNIEKHKEIIDILLKNDRGTKVDWQKIVSILIEIDSEVDPHLLKNLDVVPLILNWENQTNSTRLSYSWQKVLRENSQGVLKWLKSMEDKPISENVFKIIVSILDPNSDFVIRNGSKIWLKLLAKKGISDYTVLLVKSFGLALAFNRPDQQSIDLLFKSFESVYIALRNDGLNYNSWKPIELHTIPLIFWKDWDKCKKLVNALFNKFPEINWTKGEAEKITNDKELRDRIISKYNKMYR